jgi:ABC-type cobalt transport system substrate-binding protein
VSDWLKDSVVIDYSDELKKEYWKLYLEVGRLIIREKGVRILDYVEALNPHPELPSWCPDWSAGWMCSGIPNIYHVACLNDEGEEIDPSKNGAILVENDCVSFNGFELDTIVYVSELVWMQTGNDEEWEGADGHAAMNLRVINDNFETYSEFYSKANGVLSNETKEMLFRSYAKTLVADSQDNSRRWGSEQYKGDVAHDLKTVQKWLTGWAEEEEESDEDEWEDVSDDSEDVSKNVASESINDNASDSRSSISSSEVEDTEYSTYCQTLWGNRYFFITSSMKIGLGPRTCEVGDSVVVLFAGSYPFILRKHPNESLGEDVYKFIGCSYVDGVMFGEAAASRDPNRDREFVIG